MRIKLNALFEGVDAGLELEFFELRVSIVTRFGGCPDFQWNCCRNECQLGHGSPAPAAHPSGVRRPLNAPVPGRECKRTSERLLVSARLASTNPDEIRCPLPARQSNT